MVLWVISGFGISCFLCYDLFGVLFSFLPASNKALQTAQTKQKSLAGCVAAAPGCWRRAQLVRSGAETLTLLYNSPPSTVLQVPVSLLSCVSILVSLFGTICQGKCTVAFLCIAVYAMAKGELCCSSCFLLSSWRERKQRAKITVLYERALQRIITMCRLHRRGLNALLNLFALHLTGAGYT